MKKLIGNDPLDSQGKYIMMEAWMRVTLAYYAPTNLIPSTQVVVRKAKADSHPPKAICVKGISLIKGQAGSNPAMRTRAYGGFAFPRLCQRPKSSDIHRMIRRLPAKAVVAGAYHSESGSSIKAIAKPTKIGVKDVDDNWCSVVYNVLTCRHSSARCCLPN